MNEISLPSKVINQYKQFFHLSLAFGILILILIFKEERESYRRFILNILFVVLLGLIIIFFSFAKDFDEKMEKERKLHHLNSQKVYLILYKIFILILRNTNHIAESLMMTFSSRQMQC